MWCAFYHCNSIQPYGYKYQKCKQCLQPFANFHFLPSDSAVESVGCIFKSNASGCAPFCVGAIQLHNRPEVFVNVPPFAVGTFMATTFVCPPFGAGNKYLWRSRYSKGYGEVVGRTGYPVPVSPLLQVYGYQ
jgi:hypothetical protein